MVERCRIVIVCTNDAARSVARRAAPGARRELPYVAELTDRLARLGHDVELWTARGGDELETETLVGGATLRRIRREHDYLVPRIRPCGWVTGFVDGATEHLSRIAATGPVIVSYLWEAGVAARALSQAFGLAHVHVPEPVPPDRLDDAPSAGVGGGAATCLPSRRLDEDRQTCQEASTVVATSERHRDALVGAYGLAADGVALIAPGPDMGERFAALLPPARNTGTASPTTADPAANLPVGGFLARRGPWHALADSDIQIPRSV
jgi:mannosylfructose-phosphate synthase